MVRRDSLDAVTFAKTYATLAKAGKSALEIGQALEVEGTDKEIAQYVSVKASQLRKTLRESAEQMAKDSNMSENDAKVFVDKNTDLLPRLNRGRKAVASEVASALRDMLSELNDAE